MKSISLILALMLCFCLCPMARAEGETPAPSPTPKIYTSGDYAYILLKDGTAQITEYNGRETDLSIPQYLNDVPVTGIGDEAFAESYSLTSVIIPDGVTAIGDWAFVESHDLFAITIPDSVSNMGLNPFAECEKLVSINVSPDNPAFAVIDNVLFEKATRKLICYPTGKNESRYAIPQGIQQIGEYALYLCCELTDVDIPDSVTAIGEGAFYLCRKLTHVTIPNSVTTIGDDAFRYCTSLTTLTIPDSVTSIGKDAFYGWYGLTVTVGRDSYAAQYCKENNIPYTYPDSLDWLNSGN